MRKIYIIILVLSISALAADKLFFPSDITSPQSAEANDTVLQSKTSADTTLVTNKSKSESFADIDSARIVLTNRLSNSDTKHSESFNLFTLPNPSSNSTQITSGSYTSRTQKPDFVIDAIIINQQQNQVIINGRSYITGQTIGAFKLKSIHENHIILTHNDVLYKLTLNNLN